jgi:hypothetical protein
MRKDGGANGKLTGDGYAFIGVDPEQTDFDAIDEADENDYTKVKYIFDKIPEELK